MSLSSLARTHTFPCGLRLVHLFTVSDVAYAGFVVRSGTRHEDEADSGMAHLVEHLTFKGTQRRRACHIANGLERVGGELNAFTNKQETVYHATVLREDFPRAADLLTDIVFHSTYPEREMEREVEVVCDEIDAYRDSPSELIFDEYEALLFGGHPLGRDILGSPQRLRAYRREDVLRFVQRRYRPENAVCFVSGAIPFDRVVKTFERLFAGFPPCAPRLEPIVPLPFRLEAGHTRRVAKDTHQAHVLTGFRMPGGTDRSRYAVMLLNNLLGGPGANSRLNMSLRERAGLVYSIDSYAVMYPDAGVWQTYFGCDPADAERCRRLLERELNRLVAAPLTAAQLAAAKKQLCGQIGISTASDESVALAMAKSYARYGYLQDAADLCAALRDLTAQEVYETACTYFMPERLVTLIYTPEKDDE